MNTKTSAPKKRRMPVAKAAAKLWEKLKDKAWLVGVSQAVHDKAPSLCVIVQYSGAQSKEVQNLIARGFGGYPVTVQAVCAICYSRADLADDCRIDSYWKACITHRDGSGSRHYSDLRDYGSVSSWLHTCTGDGHKQTWLRKYVCVEERDLTNDPL